MARIAAVVVFNEEVWLPGCLESLAHQVDRVVVIDGAYAQYPHLYPFSTDLTLEIARCYGAEWIDCPNGTDGLPAPWADEVAKLNAVVKLGKSGDWILKIDADERLVGTLPALESGRHYALQSTGESDKVGYTFRLWQKRGRMQFRGSHMALWRDGDLLRPQDAIPIPPEVCRFVHLHRMRDAERLAIKRRYCRWLSESEHEYRRQHGL